MQKISLCSRVTCPKINTCARNYLNAKETIPPGTVYIQPDPETCEKYENKNIDNTFGLDQWKR